MTEEMNLIPVPPYQELTLRAASLAEQASLITIANQSDYEHAGKYVVTTHTFAREIADLFRDPKQEAAAKHKAICALENSIIAPVTRACDEVKHRMADYNEQEDRKADEKNRRDRMEAERQHQEEIERQAEEAELRGASVNEVRAILEQPSVAPVPVLPAVAHVRGISTSEQWFGEITDKRAFVREALRNNMLFGLVEIHQGRLDQMVRSLKNALNNIPGLKIGRRQTISASRRG